MLWKTPRQPEEPSWEEQTRRRQQWEQQEQREQEQRRQEAAKRHALERSGDPSCLLLRPHLSLLPQVAANRGDEVVSLQLDKPTHADLESLAAHAAQFPRLENLCLNGCAAVTDEGLRTLAALTTLLRLTLLGNTAHLTTDGIQVFRAGVPRCEVLGGPEPKSRGSKAQRVRLGLVLVTLGMVGLCVAIAVGFSGMEVLLPWKMRLVCLGMTLYLAGAVLAWTALRYRSALLAVLFGAGALALAVAQAVCLQPETLRHTLLGHLSPLAVFLFGLIFHDSMLLNFDLGWFWAKQAMWMILLTCIVAPLEGVAGLANEQHGAFGFSSAALIAGAVLVLTLMLSLIGVFRVRESDCC